MQQTSRLVNLLWTSCEQATSSMSKALDRPLPSAERAAVEVHVLLCPGCRRFRKQLKLLCSVLRLLRTGGGFAEKLPALFLPSGATERIRAVIKDRMRKSG